MGLRPIAGEDAGKSAYLKTGIHTPEAIDAQLVLDVKAPVTATLNGEPVALRAEGNGPRTARVKLARGENVLLIKVPGGSQGGVVTSFVASKPLEFR